MNKILLLVLFAVVGVLVFHAGEFVVDGSPLLALGVVAILLTLVFSLIKKAKIFES